MKRKKGQRYKSLADYKLSDLASILWEIFSLYTRLRFADFEGKVKCYTCISEGHFRSLDAGHMIPRAFLRVKFSEWNVHPQCMKCNKGLGGNRDQYEKNVERDYGSDVLKMLKNAGSDTTTFKLERSWYIKQILFYLQALRELPNYELDENKLETRHKIFIAHLYKEAA